MQEQMTLWSPFGHGGARKGAGRKRQKGSIAHETRERFSQHDPLLITCKLRGDVVTLRQAAEARVIRDKIRAAHKAGFRIVQYSIQGDHLHMIVEAADSEQLANGMRGLGCRLAKGLNKLWQRTGKLFVGRCHVRVLKSLAEVYHALRYVLNNHRKHGCASSPNEPDPFSSGVHYREWAGGISVRPPGYANPCEPARGWKLCVGWKCHYPLIRMAAVPGH